MKLTLSWLALSLRADERAKLLASKIIGLEEKSRWSWRNASRKISCWNRDGCYPSCCSSLHYRGFTYGSFTQIATCLGLICSFFIGIPAKDVSRWWCVCFWVSTVPAALLALLMEFCAESPHWLFKCYGAWYGSVPSLKVLVPYSSEDARGLLKAAIRDPDPVVFLENECLYGESFPISDEALDSSFCLPIGKAKIEREGKDITITAFSKMIGYALKAAEILEKDGISA